MGPNYLEHMILPPLDYGRSFLIGTGAGNEVRFWIESRTRIVDGDSGEAEDYWQTASCKSEHTFAERDLFQQDNYDFLPIFGPDFGIIFRRKAYLNPAYKQIVASDIMFGGHAFHLVEASAVSELTDNEAIREATYSFAPIVSQTEIWNDETGLRAIIECPVKTMNTRREGDIYQVDTGPVAFPELSHQGRSVDSISLAFLAFNTPHFIDVVIEAETAIAGDAAVHHFSELQTLPATNRLFALDS